MQLPRGTFQYIKKDTILGGILEELQLMKFSGICTISFGSANGSLVFKSGKRILAEFRNISGDEAWNELQKIFGEKVDAAVSTMDDTQIELSLEFNKTCRIGKGKPEPSPSFSSKMDQILAVKKFPQVSHRESLATPVKTFQKTHVQEISSAHPIVTFETLQTPEPSQILQNQTQQKKSPLPPPSLHTPTIHQQPPEILPVSGKPKESEDKPESTDDEDSKSFDSDIDTIETMDVDIMTSKIRGECKTLIKQLRLEHLTER
jgi:hypothetical protein